MRWLVYGSAGASFIGAVFLYIASSPWMVWHSAPPADHILLVFSKTLPKSLAGKDAQYFTSWPDRWRFVATHSSREAWKETAKTLWNGSAPFHPAALLYTERWMKTPTLIMATSEKTTMRALAQPASQSDSRTAGIRLPIKAAESSLLQITAPGIILEELPQPLRAAWNDTLQQRLGFTATKPDILAELPQYKWALVSIKPESSAIGISAASEEERQRWQKTVKSWVVEEDRFRRPVTQSFRLPDGTGGKEIIAGAPGSVWRDEKQGDCLAPLPDKPKLWSCGTMANMVLANYHWQADEAPQLKNDMTWEIAISADWLKALPGIKTLTAGGNDMRAAAVIQGGNE